jgi:hypothetical protein
MGGEVRRVEGRPVVAAVCARCRGDVDREREAWAACRSCLSRHHAGCFGPCAACGEAEKLDVAAPAEVGAGLDLPALPITLDGTRGRDGEVDARAPLLVRDGAGVSGLLIVVENATDRAQRVEVRQLPPWLRVEGPSGLDLAPGERATLPLIVDAALAPARARDLLAGVVDKGLPAGTFIVSSSDEARTVGVWLWRAPSLLRTVGLGLACSLLGLPGLLLLAMGLRALVKRESEATGPGIEPALLARVARGDRRMGLVTLLSVVATFAAVLTLLSSLATPP